MSAGDSLACPSSSSAGPDTCRLIPCSAVADHRATPLPHPAPQQQVRPRNCDLAPPVEISRTIVDPLGLADAAREVGQHQVDHEPVERVGFIGLRLDRSALVHDRGKAAAPAMRAVAALIARAIVQIADRVLAHRLSHRAAGWVGEGTRSGQRSNRTKDFHRLRCERHDMLERIVLAQIELLLHLLRRYAPQCVRNVTADRSS